MVAEGGDAGFIGEEAEERAVGTYKVLSEWRTACAGGKGLLVGSRRYSTGNIPSPKGVTAPRPVTRTLCIT